MKLKTRFQDEDFEIGEVVDVDIATMPDGRIKLQGVAKAGGLHTIFYDKLENLYEDWEDYEEHVKPYWFINDLDGEPMKCDLKNCGKSNFVSWYKLRKQFGNDFESEEEAKKAVEKLKAWKRLKDNGFEFGDWFDRCGEDDMGTIVFHYKADEWNKADLDLLFGDEE